VNGVPVFVNPTIIPNQMAHEDLEQKDYTIDGVNGFDFLQQSDQWMDVDEEAEDSKVKTKNDDY